MDQQKNNSLNPSEVDKQIDDNLKRVFENMANEPVPDKFTKLLDQLRSGGDDKSGGSDA